MQQSMARRCTPVLSEVLQQAALVRAVLVGVCEDWPRSRLSCKRTTKQQSRAPQVQQILVIHMQLQLFSFISISQVQHSTAHLRSVAVAVAAASASTMPKHSFAACAAPQPPTHKVLIVDYA
jgi:hypothetical protein